MRKKSFVYFSATIFTHIYEPDMSLLLYCFKKKKKSLIIPFLVCACMTDEGQTVCGSPADTQGRRLGEVGIQLRTLCHQTLGSWDYLFFVAIGFVIFAAGTVSAWLMGVIMVLYERYIKKKDEQLDADEEEETSGTGRSSRARSDHGNGNLKMSHTV